MKGDTRATPGTDRARLRCAYADSGKFDARRSLYAYVHPRVDVVGWALDHVQFRSGGSVVDVGCGPGYYFSRLGDRDLSLVGIDLSEGMLAKARARVGDSFLLGDAQRLPVRTESFDVALAMHMLYHVPDSALAVSELRRVLRPGGTLLVSAPARDHLAEVRALVADVMASASNVRAPASDSRTQRVLWLANSKTSNATTCGANSGSPNQIRFSPTSPAAPTSTSRCCRKGRRGRVSSRGSRPAYVKKSSSPASSARGRT